MVPNMPDAIGCNVDYWGFSIFYLIHAPFANTNAFEYRMPSHDKNYDIEFNTDGTHYRTINIAASDCDDKSIYDLIASGQAFNFGAPSSAGTELVDTMAILNQTLSSSISSLSISENFRFLLIGNICF